jgi:hypothetical protein
MRLKVSLSLSLSLSFAKGVTVTAELRVTISRCNQSVRLGNCEDTALQILRRRGRGSKIIITFMVAFN